MSGGVAGVEELAFSVIGIAPAQYRRMGPATNQC